MPLHAGVPAQRRSRSPVALLAVILIIVAVGAVAGVAALVSPQARASLAKLIPGLTGGRTEAAATTAHTAPEGAIAPQPASPGAGPAATNAEPGTPGSTAGRAAAGPALAAGAPALSDGSEGMVPPAHRDEAAALHPPMAAVPGPGRRPAPPPEPAAAAPEASFLAQPLHGTTVVVTGERLLAGFVETLLEGEVAGHGSSLVDIETLPAADTVVRGRDSVSPAELLPVLRQEGVARLLLARVEYVSSRQLSYMGRSDTAYSSRITVTVYDVASGRPTGRSVSEMVEYTSLNAERQVERALLPRSQDILQLLD